jgi:hypothetical protein
MEDIKVLLPIVRPIDPRTPIGEVESDPLRRVARPSSYVDLPRSLIRKDERGRAEHVALYMHGAIRLGKVIREGKVELVCTRAVGERGRSRLLEEGHLVVNAERGDERNDDSTDQELVRDEIVERGLREETG